MWSVVAREELFFTSADAIRCVWTEASGAETGPRIFAAVSTARFVGRRRRIRTFDRGRVVDVDDVVVVVVQVFLAERRSPEAVGSPET